MRPILSASVAAMLAAPLAGCGESDDAFRSAYRARSVESCAAGARSAAANAPAGLDFQRMCECAVDRYMANTSVEDLRAQEKQSQAPPAAQQALQQCLTEQMRASAKG